MKKTLTFLNEANFKLKIPTIRAGITLFEFYR